MILSVFAPHSIMIHEPVVRLLVENGGNVSVTDTHGWTPLQAVVRFLIDEGADVSVITADGYTPLWEAVNNGHEAVIRLLVEY
jgi:ankyrin repeat protein